MCYDENEHPRFRSLWMIPQSDKRTRPMQHQARFKTLMCTQNSTKNICFLFQKNGGGGDGGAGGSLEDDCGMAGMEMASLSSRYAFFENAKKKEEEEEKKKYMRRTPPKVWPTTYLEFFI